MAKKLIKWTFRVIGCILLLVLLFYAYIHVVMGQRIGKTYDVSAAAFVIPADSATVEKGKHLVAIKGCNECHGANLGGQVLSDDAAFGTLVARNLTRGKGGLPDSYGTNEWILALKHGLRTDKKPLLFMPSQETSKLSEEDMAAIIAFCSQAAPVDNELPSTSPGFLARILGFFDQIPLLPAELIDHRSTLQKQVNENVPIEFGKYLSVNCQSCHRPDLKGGEPLGPGMPPVPDISGTGAGGEWTASQFQHFLTTGIRPNGSQVSNDNMPWKMTAHFNAKEMEALYTYLKSIK